MEQKRKCAREERLVGYTVRGIVANAVDMWNIPVFI